VTATESANLIARRNAIDASVWVGWFSVIAVGAEIAANPALHHRSLVLTLDALAALANLSFGLVPWKAWLAARRGQLLLDLWSGGLIGFVTLLCLVAGSGAEFDLLLFLVLPFLATVQGGRHRTVWIAVAGIAFGAAALHGPLTASAAVLRASLLAATVVLAATFARSIRVEAERRVAATARAELEHTLIAEAHHRIKNSLQMVSDLLLLGRPAGGAGLAFDETAARIRGIATVHQLLGERDGGSIDADALLRRVASGIDDSVRVEADPILLDAPEAQRLGIVGNELIANAIRHGSGPVNVRLLAGSECALIVEDGGFLGGTTDSGLGLQLVRSVVRNGLKGSFSLSARPEGGTRAEVTFARRTHADSRR
jgi:two-component sensor histidine kinase